MFKKRHFGRKNSGYLEDWNESQTDVFLSPNRTRVTLIEIV
jgi:hypothetical protein